MKKSICLIILSFAIGVNAATLTVTKTADTADGTCGADCSLREAITAANNLAGADTIILPAGTYTTTIATTNENANANGDLDINTSLTIIGAGEASTFVEANASPGAAFDRVFHVLGVSTNAVIEGVTVRNGRTLATAPQFRGGGIRSEGNLTLRKVTVSGNHRKCYRHRSSSTARDRNRDARRRNCEYQSEYSFIAGQGYRDE